MSPMAGYLAWRAVLEPRTNPSKGPRSQDLRRGSTGSLMKYDSLMISDPAGLLFGGAPHPVATRSGMVIGGGTVYPELNFTLPPMTIDASSMPEVRQNYRQIISEALRRAAELEAPGVVVEFETLPPMTEFPDLGIEVVEILLDGHARPRRSAAG